MTIDHHERQICLNFIKAMLVIQNRMSIHLAVHNKHKGPTNWNSWKIEEA